MPHVLLLELFTDAGIGTMITAEEAPVSTAAPASPSPLMPTYPPPPVTFVRGEGTELWDDDGQAATSTSCPGWP